MKLNYLKMIQQMKRGRRREWSVYILRCREGSLYTGIAKDVVARIDRHNAGKGAAYTRTRRPVRLVHQENGLTRSKALIREAEIKAMPRPKKMALADQSAKRFRLLIGRNTRYGQRWRRIVRKRVKRSRTR